MPASLATPSPATTASVVPHRRSRSLLAPRRSSIAVWLDHHRVASLPSRPPSSVLFRSSTTAPLHSTTTLVLFGSRSPCCVCLRSRPPCPILSGATPLARSPISGAIQVSLYSLLYQGQAPTLRTSCFGRSQSYQQWDSLTSKFSAAANIPFLLLQMPQIILNARNLLSGNKTALSAIPWLGMLTSLLGNLSLLSYFAKKREKEAVVVQTLGVVSTYVVLVQLALAEAMPLPYFLATSVVVMSGLVLNFLNYFGLLNDGLWRFWEDFITIGGLSVLPQIMWSTFVPYLPNSILPGATAFVIAILAVTLARTGKLSEKGVKFVGGISGWTATLLFMWMPVSQLWTNYLNPENMKGLSAFSMLLAMLGNGLMLPRALLIRDFMW
ncbi:maltose excess protein 1-like, chloroplastic [Vigna umbellata]|uniref:maltose excess protein 1-like, chloroplastic n=1 Tax=Vigna umbellata TaxID=87088 RepID=UPI001F5EEA6E|nr:maltose excess protein 1-like, chloroplastic [Vigna umbellata]